MSTIVGPPASPAIRLALAAAPVAALAALAALTYGPVGGHGYVQFDDYHNFIYNADFRGFGPRQVAWAWTAFLLGVYQPISWMLLSAQSALWGMEPSGYHLTSLALHGLNAVVLYRVILAILGRSGRVAGRGASTKVASAFAAALFLAHPLRAEVVSWLSCQPYLPCALFAMLAVLAYLRAHPAEGPGRPGWLAASFALYGASLLCKAAAISLPAVFLILDLAVLRRGAGDKDRGRPGPGIGRLLVEKLPFFALGAAFMVIAFRVRGHTAGVPLGQQGISSALARVGYAAVFYPIKTLIPDHLMAFYMLPGRVGLDQPLYALAFAVALAATAVAWALRRRAPGLLAAWAGYLALLAPSSGIVYFGPLIAADRYSYLPMMAWAVPIAWGLDRVLSRRGPLRLPALGAAVIALGALAGLAREQSKVWSSSITLWEHAIAHGAADSADVHSNLGVALASQGRMEDALAHYEIALRLEPDHVPSLINRGYAFAQSGRIEEAVPLFRRALELDPDDPVNRVNLGTALVDTGQPVAAEAELREAIRRSPRLGEAHTRLGMALRAQGRDEEAVGSLQLAAEFDRFRPEPCLALGYTLGKLGRVEAGMASLREALRRAPDHAEAHHDLAVLLARRGRLDEAVEHFRLALRLAPEQPELRINLADALDRLGRLDEAAEQMEAAVRLRPGHAPTLRASADLRRRREAGRAGPSAEAAPRAPDGPAQIDRRG